jgi:uncharacterized protein (DUF885 family)
MIALQPAPLITRPVRTQASSPSHAQASSQAVTPSRSTALRTGSVEGQPESPSLEERIDASVDAALAEALAKVKTPADDALAKQQQAFDQMMQLRTEQEREANAIREFGLAQQKKENDFLTEYIRMI